MTELVQSYQHKTPVKEAPIQLKIILRDERPIAQRPRHLTLCEQGIVEEQVNEWLKDGIIRVSYSKFSSPLVAVLTTDY